MKNVVYIKNHKSGAGKWIYNGYASAWKKIGYDVLFFDNIFDVKNNAKFIMTTEADLNNGIEILNNVEKSFVFVQPFKFEKPWGLHPNWITCVDEKKVEKINSSNQIKKWTFVNHFKNDNYKPWNDVKYFPLAFDSINYKVEKFKNEKTFDVCFIGGWADNGFNEKQKRIIDYLNPFQSLGIKCGFYVNSGLTHEQENFVISSSKVSLNIHDEYQNKLGLDLNERTFKSLGLCGILVSDYVDEMKNLFPDVNISYTPKDMIDYVLFYLNQDESKLIYEREKNQKLILDLHTYINRVEEMIKL